jgi:hypothetical protein
MKMKLIIRKRTGGVLYQGVHEVIDAESFGRAFVDVWAQVQDQRLQKTTSIGDLMDVLNDDVIEELNGAFIDIARL